MISLPQVIFACLLVLVLGMPLLGEDTEEDRIREAIGREDLAAVKRLIAEGVDLNAVDIDRTHPPLKTAVDQGDLEIVRLLLANGADPNGTVVEGPMVDIPICFYVLDRGDKVMLDLFIERGVKGDGIGEKIAFTPFDFVRGTEIDSIAVVPGYAADKYFRRNNRVKQAVLSVYSTGVYCSQGETSYSIGEMIFQKKLAFSDDMRFQEFPLEIPGYEENLVLTGEVLFVLEIKEIYPGSDWDDTCIAEIKLTDREGRQIPIISKNP